MATSSYIPQGFSGKGTWEEQKNELIGLGVSSPYIPRMTNVGDSPGMVFNKTAVAGNADRGAERIIWDGTKFVDNSANYTASKTPRTSTTAVGATPVSPATGAAPGGIVAPSSGTAGSLPQGLLMPQGSGMTLSYGATGQNIDALTRDLTPDELASYQLDKIIGKDSALSQRAMTAGRQYANSRGLLNGSMGADAAYGAWVDRASPIAMDDAGKYTNVLDKNLGYQNEFRMADKGFGFDLKLQENDLGWKSGENALDRGLTRSENSADRSHQTNLQSMGDAAAMSRQTSEQSWRSGEGALDRAATSAENQAGRDFTTGQNQLERDFTAGQNDLNRDFDRETQLKAAEIDSESRLTQHLYTLDELGYRFDLDQYNVSKTYAANMAGGLSTELAAIRSDPNTDPVTKKTLEDSAIANFNDMMKFGSTVYSTEIPVYGGGAVAQPPKPVSPYQAANPA